MFALVLRLPPPLASAGALEPAFALDRKLKAACVLGAELAVFELEPVLVPLVELDALLALPVPLDAALARPVELDAALALPVPLGAALALSVELDAALALSVVARLEESALCVFPAVGGGAWLADWGIGLGGGAGGVGAAVVASSMAAKGWPSVCCA